MWVPEFVEQSNNMCLGFDWNSNSGEPRIRKLLCNYIKIAFILSQNIELIFI